MTISVENSVSSEQTKKTRFALIASFLLNEPIVSIFAVFTIILTKYLGATSFQIAIFTMLKPAVSVFSFYWSMRAIHKPQMLRSGLVLTTALSVIPFLFFPFIDNLWFFIISSAWYMVFSRAQVPALMEILKLNLPKKPRERLFSIASTAAYATGAVIGLLIGEILDYKGSTWKLVFFVSSLFVLIGALIQRSFPLPQQEDQAHNEPSPQKDLVQWLLHPIKETIRVLKERPDFAHFQWGFMITMIGLMLAMPAVPFFLTNQQLSFVELMISFNICKGLGFIIATPFWTKSFKKYTIHTISNAVCMGFGLFYLLMLLTVFGPIWLFISYLFYGIVQAGSHLLWHLSGPIFAHNQNSQLYSAVNILMVGIRGAFVPPLGALSCDLFGPMATIAAGMCICFFGGCYLLIVKIDTKEAPQGT
jgi:MFS family permease